MQHIGRSVVAMLVLAGASSRPTAAQQATGTTLWRVAGTTLATPPALAVGPAAALWNPAQTADTARVMLAFEAIQTPSAVDASGMIATARVQAGRLGQIGVIFGRVGLSDITQTLDSPDPTGTTVPVYTLALGATWSRVLGATSVGATVAFHQTRLDAERSERVTLDVGARRPLLGDRFHVALATHFFSSFKTTDPAQDIYAGADARLWSGLYSTERAVIRARYGVSFAHGFAADQQFGLGAELGKSLAFDVMLAREGGYGNDAAGWRPVAGLRVGIGKYRITLARDAGVNDLGSAYRVGVDARLR
ncbi:MAG TPA: hypothetical protein VL549_03095 [Gemmatimonadales bacterium]|nr:hypothetical protein [Gemmatimonadales bacterium]